MIMLLASGPPRFLLSVLFVCVFILLFLFDFLTIMTFYPSSSSPSFPPYPHHYYYSSLPSHYYSSLPSHFHPPASSSPSEVQFIAFLFFIFLFALLPILPPVLVLVVALFPLILLCSPSLALLSAQPFLLPSLLLLLLLATFVLLSVHPAPHFFSRSCGS